MPLMHVGMITFDTLDPVPLATWWARHTGGEVVDRSGGEYVTVTSEGPTLSFQRVPEPTPGKNRVHLDMVVVDRLTAVEVLTADGATVVEQHESHSFRWTVLADPDGNVFCVSQHNGA